MTREEEKNLRGLQETLKYIFQDESDKARNASSILENCIAYLKEAQLNHRIPKEINIDKEVFYEMSDDSKKMFVSFSERLENFLTNNGDFIVIDSPFPEDL